LDRQGRPVPVGIPGELLIGGDGLARGYLHRPELTAERFIPDPFSGQPGARLYRTGDLARFRADGRVEFMGRLDFQVKVRGYRIELGEIEHVMDRHPAIREAVVIAREDNPGDKRLVAYYQLQNGAENPGNGAWRDFLGEHLPDYMIPSQFMPLAEFPLTPNRKVDRKALPAPAGYRPERERPYSAPGSDLEH
ncbi:MAG: AMP-binding protein, partial [Anaerolineales bacterium]|nr:AMP-binding protein [Anaerolineales bacterium]